MFHRWAILRLSNKRKRSKLLRDVKVWHLGHRRLPGEIATVRFDPNAAKNVSEPDFARLWFFPKRSPRDLHRHDYTLLFDLRCGLHSGAIFPIGNTFARR